jgi:hypothetical protein
VHHPAGDADGELATGQDLDPEPLAGGGGLRDRGDGVVVGDRQHPDPGRSRRLHQLRGPVAAVAGGGVGVEVDQGGHPVVRHGR